LPDPLVIWEYYENAFNVWNKVDMPIGVKAKQYQVVFEAEYTQMDPMPPGDIAIDDISFTPQCR